MSSDTKEKTTMEEVLEFWHNQHRGKLEGLRLTVLGLHDNTLRFGYEEQILAIYLPDPKHIKEDSLESFMCFPDIRDPESGDMDIFDRAVTSLNDRLEKLNPLQDDITSVLNEVMQVCVNIYISKTSKEIAQKFFLHEDYRGIATSLEEVAMEAQVACQKALHMPSMPSAIYAPPIEAQTACQKALHVPPMPSASPPMEAQVACQKELSMSPVPSNALAQAACQNALSMPSVPSINPLAWCTVTSFPYKRLVRMEMDYRGILSHAKKFAEAIGFPFDGSTLVIEARFDGEGDWELGPNFDAYVSPSPCEEEEFYKEERGCLVRSVKHRISCHQYGSRVLVRQLIQDFWSQQGGLERSGNLFVDLLLFIGAGLPKLSNQCVNCKEELPGLSRQFYCDRELCLFTFEDIGLGFSILQELQDSELVEFEIEVAKKACRSQHDIFEPYPSFLLKSQEIRKHSGIISDISDNKNLELMKKIVDSFPSADVIKGCLTETELIFILYRSWRAYLFGLESFPSEEDVMLPYNVLRFILFTNRQILCPLKESMLLEFATGIRQFVVLYDNEAEQRFEQMRGANGSIFAFHGNGPANWYSIIRNGLKGLSGTKYMSHGDHGKGVYFSKSPKNIWIDASSLLIDNVNDCQVVGICEIFSGTYTTLGNDMLVVPADEESTIVLRYLIVFPVDSIYRYLEICDNFEQRYFGKIDLVEHYKLSRDIYAQEENYSNRIIRENCLDVLFEKQKLNEIIDKTPTSIPVSYEEEYEEDRQRCSCCQIL